MAVGMVLGVTVLAGAALASYNTSNGYEVGKNALKGLLENENYTSEFNMKFTLDGEKYEAVSSTELHDRDSDVSYNSTVTYENGNKNVVYIQDDILIDTDYVDGSTSTGVYYDTIYRSADFDMISDATEEDRERINKIIRFVELVADTMVGDLKNNIVYVTGDDNFSTYEINLDAIQIPEYVNAGLSAMFSSMSYNDEPFLVFGDDPIVSNASLKFTVDNEGRVTDGVASATMVGYDENNEKHSATADISLKMYDYGTTVPQRVDIDTLENVKYYD